MNDPYTSWYTCFRKMAYDAEYLVPRGAALREKYIMTMIKHHPCQKLSGSIDIFRL